MGKAKNKLAAAAKAITKPRRKAAAAAPPEMVVSETPETRVAEAAPAPVPGEKKAAEKKILAQTIYG